MKEAITAPGQSATDGALAIAFAERGCEAFCGDDVNCLCVPLSWKIAAFAAAQVAAEREECAKEMDNLAYCEMCSDDTAQGNREAMPYYRAAKAIRARKSP